MLINLFGMGPVFGALSFETGAGNPEGGAAGAAGGAGGGAAGGQPPEGGAAGGGGKPPEGGTVPETFTLKVAGEEKTYTRDEILELASKGGDYQGKTTALADDRKTWESDRESLVRSEVDKRVEQMIAEDKSKASDDDELSLEEKNAKRLTSLEQRRQDDQLEDRIAEYKKQYGKQFNRSMFIDMAMEAGAQEIKELDNIAAKHVESVKADNMELVKTVLADENHPLTKEFSKKIVDTYVEKKLNSSPAAGGGSTGPTEIPAGKDGKALTADEIDELSVRELQGLNQ